MAQAALILLGEKSDLGINCSHLPLFSNHMLQWEQNILSEWMGGSQVILDRRV